MRSRPGAPLGLAGATAWAGLATVHATRYEWFGARLDDRAGAERASKRALQLAPSLAEAHVARGFTQSLMRRHDEAMGHFEEAIAINPNLYERPRGRGARAARE